MSLILSGTDGLSDIDGSAATPAIRGTDANTGIFFPAADTIAFSEGGAEAMRINSSGNVGIGTASPAVKLEVQADLSANTEIARFSHSTGDTGRGAKISLGVSGYPMAQLEGFADSAGNGSLRFYTYTSTTTTEKMRIDSSGNVGIGTTATTYNYQTKNIALYDATSAGISIASGSKVLTLTSQSSGGVFVGSRSNDNLIFTTNDIERMRITAGGVLMLGNTTFTNSGLDAGAAYINSNLYIGNSAGTAAYNVRIDGFSDKIYFAWNNGTADVNSISYAYGGTAWVQTSDETLKDIIEPITDAANKVSTLRAVIGKFKTEEEGIRHPFLIAQDVQAVLPEAVYVNKSRVEGEPDTLGIGYTDVIPLLVAAIKEQQALILSLATRLTALETP
jgi:hypothetical protein